MQVAELFVSLGVKGADKAVGALNNTRKTLNDVTSTSLETKAGILGVLYATQQLVSSSNAAGMGLTQFAQRTGISIDYLQRFQAMARASGISADEMAGNLENVQKAMAQLAIGKAPQGLQALSNVVNFDRSKARDTQYVMSKLREYAQKTKDTPDISNIVLSSFGLSGNSIGMLRNSTFDLNKVPRSSMYSGKETAALAKMSAGWSELGNSVEKSIGKLNVRFGPSLLKDLTQLTGQVLKMVSAFAVLAEKLQLVAEIGKVFSGWSQIFQVVTETLNDKNRPSLKSLAGAGLGMLDETIRGGPADRLKNSASNKEVNITTNVTVHGAGDAASIGQKIGEHVNRLINTSQRQQPQGGNF